MPMSKTWGTIISAAVSAVIGGIATFAGAWYTARAGRISFPNPALEQQVVDLKKQLENQSRLTGDFEWQWAGDNWLSSVTFQSLADGTINALIDGRSVKLEPGSQPRGYRITPAFRSTVSGSAAIVDAATVKLNLPVAMDPQFRKLHHVSATTVVLQAELKHVDAFAGRVSYLGDEPIPRTGDMILVRYRSDPRNW